MIITIFSAKIEIKSFNQKKCHWKHQKNKLNRDHKTPFVESSIPLVLNVFDLLSYSSKVKIVLESFWMFCRCSGIIIH